MHPQPHFYHAIHYPPPQTGRTSSDQESAPAIQRGGDGSQSETGSLEQVDVDKGEDTPSHEKEFPHYGFMQSPPPGRPHANNHR